MSDPANSKITVGDFLYLNDLVTGFSKDDKLRWCIVTRVVAGSVRVAGRSATRRDGVPVPKEAMERFDKDGWVMRDTLRISLSEAEAAENIGQIDDHYLQQILFFVNEDVL